MRTGNVPVSGGEATLAPGYALAHPQLLIIIPAMLFNPGKMILHRSLDARHNGQLHFCAFCFLCNSKADQCQIIILFTVDLTNNFAPLTHGFPLLLLVSFYFG